MIKRVISTLILLISSVNALKIEINRGQVKPDIIAITDFVASGNNKANDICKIIKNDLNSSGLFETLNNDLFLEDPNKLVQKGPNLKSWSIINARFLVYGEISNDSYIEFVLVDVIAQKTMLKEKIKINKLNYRETAHIIADKIYERITNECGYFNTKLIYVTTTNNRSEKRTTNLIIMDQDGYNAVALTDGKNLVISPRYAPGGKTIAYISYNEKSKGALKQSAHVYIQDIQSQHTKLLINESLLKELVKKNDGNPVTMTYSPRFSSDALQIVLAIIIKGSSAIYKLNLTNKQLIQLTSHNKIDTSPCFSPDNKQIVFTSDREGKEAIYIMNADGSNQRKISQGTGKYSQPVWSPRGDLIAFAKQEKGAFYIGVMKPDGTGERLIVSNYLVESPNWASNGRYVIYTQQNGPKYKPQIAMTDLTGRYHRMIPTKGDASSPAWSATYKN